MTSRFTRNFQRPADFALFFRIVGLSVFVRTALVFISPLKLVRLLDGHRPPGRSISPEKAGKFTDFINGFKNGAPGGCLIRALILFRLFSVAGLPVSIYFGLDKDVRPGIELTGHSWVALAGRAVLEKCDPDRKYSVTYSYSISRQ